MADRLFAQVCGGEVVTIDRLLTPPSGDVLATLARDHKQFATLVQLAGLDKVLPESNLCDFHRTPWG